METLKYVCISFQATAVHGHLAVLNRLGHGESLTDARGVGQDDARSCAPPEALLPPHNNQKTRSQPVAKCDCSHCTPIGLLSFNPTIPCAGTHIGSTPNNHLEPVPKPTSNFYPQANAVGENVTQFSLFLIGIHLFSNEFVLIKVPGTKIKLGHPQNNKLDQYCCCYSMSPGKLIKTIL